MDFGREGILWLGLDGEIYFQLSFKFVPILRLFRWPRVVDQVIIIAIRTCRFNPPFYSTRIQSYSMQRLTLLHGSSGAI